jgi:hypothetical protein
VFSVGSDQSLYNESLFVARGIRELELGVQNGNTMEYNREWEYNGVQQRMGIQWSITENPRMRIEFSCR